VTELVPEPDAHSLRSAHVVPLDDDDDSSDSLSELASDIMPLVTAATKLLNEVLACLDASTMQEVRRRYGAVPVAPTATAAAGGGAAAGGSGGAAAGPSSGQMKAYYRTLSFWLPRYAQQLCSTIVKTATMLHCYFGTAIIHTATILQEFGET
jgi:hypothetical protein